MLFPTERCEKNNLGKTSKCHDAADKFFTKCFFWVTKCEKYSYCPCKNATFNEASMSYHMG